MLGGQPAQPKNSSNVTMASRNQGLFIGVLILEDDLLDVSLKAQSLRSMIGFCHRSSE